MPLLPLATRSPFSRNAEDILVIMLDYDGNRMKTYVAIIVELYY